MLKRRLALPVLNVLRKYVHQVGPIYKIVLEYVCHSTEKRQDIWELTFSTYAIKNVCVLTRQSYTDSCQTADLLTHLEQAPFRECDKRTK